MWGNPCGERQDARVAVVRGSPGGSSCCPPRHQFVLSGREPSGRWLSRHQSTPSARGASTRGHSRVGERMRPLLITACSQLSLSPPLPALSVRSTSAFSAFSRGAPRAAFPAALAARHAGSRSPWPRGERLVLRGGWCPVVCFPPSAGEERRRPRPPSAKPVHRLTRPSASQLVVRNREARPLNTSGCRSRPSRSPGVQLLDDRLLRSVLPCLAFSPRERGGRAGGLHSTVQFSFLPPSPGSVRARRRSIDEHVGPGFLPRHRRLIAPTPSRRCPRRRH